MDYLSIGGALYSADGLTHRASKTTVATTTTTKTNYLPN
jgi:hypothetical protein